MAEIKQELVLEDKFSTVFEKFLKQLQQSIERQDNLSKQLDDNNKHLSDMRDNLQKFGDNAFKAADGAVSKLTGNILKLGAAFIGLNKARQMFSEGLQNTKMSYHLSEEFNGGTVNPRAMSNLVFNMANRYGQNVNHFASALESMSKIVSGAENVNKLTDMAARLTVKNSGTTVVGNMQTLSNMLMSRDVSGLDQFGLFKSDIIRKRLKFHLEMGDLDYVVQTLDNLMNKAGLTAEAFERINNNPAARLEKIGNIINNSVVKAFTMLIRGMEPAIQLLERFTKSQQFVDFMNKLGTVFYNAGLLIGQFIEFIINLSPILLEFVNRGLKVAIEAMEWFKDNGELVLDVLKKIGIGLLIAKGAQVAYNASLLVANGLLGIMKASMTVFGGVTSLYSIAAKGATGATMGLNAAMMANPAGAVAAAILGVVALIIALNTWLAKTETNSWGEAFLQGLRNTFVQAYEIVRAFYNDFINIANPLIVAFTKIANALQDVFTNPFDSIISLAQAAVNIIMAATNQITSKMAAFSNLVDSIRKWTGLFGGEEAVKKEQQTIAKNNLAWAEEDLAKLDPNKNKNQYKYQEAYVKTLQKYVERGDFSAAELQRINNTWGSRIITGALEDKKQNPNKYSEPFQFKPLTKTGEELGQDLDGFINNWKAEWDKLAKGDMSLQDFISTVEDTEDSLGQMGNKIDQINTNFDPDKWMEGFKEYFTEQQEYQNVVRVNNQVASPVVNINVTNNNTGGMQTTQNMLDAVATAVEHGNNIAANEFAEVYN